LLEIKWIPAEIQLIFKLKLNFERIINKIYKNLFRFFYLRLENPYSFEIDQTELTDSDIKIPQPIQMPPSLDETQFKYIDTLDDLVWLCDHLGKKNRATIKEISVDLEHHSYRSFLGFTCLMQISTRSSDFIVDTIKLRSELHRLNEIFTDWTLVKVMHGADFDIEWLQKDFGIYVVNMFDTGQATRILQYPHFSLSYLLQKFCNVNAQKQYQLADWRQRPLSDAMIRYAREDTHYLIFIYDQLRQELVRKESTDGLSQLKLVHEKSKSICRKVFKKPVFLSKGFLTLCQHNSHLNSKQMKALRDLFEWRDKMARESDESCEYVLKNHQLLKIAELLPREIYGILALCNPLSSLVQANVHEMNEIIKNAREFKGTFTSLDVENEKMNTSLNAAAVNLNQNSSAQKPESVFESIVHLASYDPNSMINNPHDLPHQQSDQNANEESMNVDTNHDNEVKLNLKDLLIKPSVKASFSLPENLFEIKCSKLSDLFVKELTHQTKEKTTKTLQEKIKKINDSIENPFSMFLPKEMRLNANQNEKHISWNLLKSTENNQSLNSTGNLSKPEEPIKIDQDELMIPLKRQFYLEKFSGEKKSKTKHTKNLEYTEAIIEYNRIQEENQAGLRNSNESSDSEDGQVDSHQKKLSNVIEQKILSNLKHLANASANGNQEATSATSEASFEYEKEKINKMFYNSNETKGDYDPTSKIRKSTLNRVNKRRTTNAVTRSNNSKSVTFRVTNPNSK
jgi:ribonuclease D